MTKFGAVSILLLCTLLLGCNRQPVEFVASLASEATDKERLSVCHAILGSIEDTFTYKSEGTFIYKTYNNKPEKYCSFGGQNVSIGKLENKDLNGCYTLTKAQVKRGGSPTYVEYNPKFSPYKDGKIYWRCENGSRPDRKIQKRENYQITLYRYKKDPKVLIVNGGYFNYFFYEGKIFRRISEKGQVTPFNNTTPLKDEDLFDRGLLFFPFEK